MICLVALLLNMFVLGKSSPLVDAAESDTQLVADLADD